MNYGMPYKGSKNVIAPQLVEQMPAGGTFYDLFCGGCAVTHAAILSGKFERFVINDNFSVAVKGFVRAISGGFADEQRWIGRQAFHRLKDTDPYAALCFSFAYNCYSYMYNEKVEDIKHAFFDAVMSGDLSYYEANLFGAGDMAEMHAVMDPIPLTERVHRRSVLSKFLRRKLDFLDNGSVRAWSDCPRNLLGLERLQALGTLGKSRAVMLTGYTTDYQDVVIEGPGVIYCDIPYLGQDPYRNKPFDYVRFYEWCEKQTLPVFISSVEMPVRRLAEVFRVGKQNNMYPGGKTAYKERLFVPRSQLEKTHGN